MEGTLSFRYTTGVFWANARKMLVIAQLGFVGAVILVFIVPVALIFLLIDKLTFGEGNF